MIPVALKRKLEYKGSYISEVISRSKLEFYFTYFKDNNHLFSGANFESEQLDKFITDTLESIEVQDDAKVQRKEDVINNSIHDDEVELQNEHEDDSISSELIEQKIDDEIPNYLTNIPFDTLICENVGTREGEGTVMQIAADAIIKIEKSVKLKAINDDSDTSDSDHGSEKEKISATQTTKSKLEIKVYAPGVSGKFVNFDYVEFIEEKSFPHLFPEGNYDVLKSKTKCKFINRFLKNFQAPVATSAHSNQKEWGSFNT